MAEQDLHLITGHKGEAHITALNDRHRLRALYSNENYRLYAANNRTTTGTYQFICKVKTENGTGDNEGLVRLTITKGMVLWNGMLIEIESDVSSDYVESLTNYKVYLHYQKTGEGQVETVKILFTTTSKTTKSNSAFYDDVTDAYVLFYQYNETLDNGWKFPLKDTAIGTIENGLNAVNTSISSLNTAVGNMFSKANLYRMFGTGATTYTSERKKLGNSIFQIASTANNTEETTFTLSESLSNYMFTEIRIGSDQKDCAIFCVPTFQLTIMSGGGNKSAFGGGSTESRLNWRYVYGGRIYDMFSFIYCDDDTVHIGKLKRFIDGSFSALSTGSNIYIYGVGKVN